MATSVEAATQTDDANFDQSQADERDDNTGHQRRDDFACQMDKRADEDWNEGTCHASSKDNAEGGLLASPFGHNGLAKRNDRTHENEACALNAEQSGTNGPDSATLQQRACAGDEKGHADQKRFVGSGQIQCFRDDERRGDNTNENRQHMLKGDESGLAEGRPIIQSVDEVSFDSFLNGHPLGFTKVCQTTYSRGT
jgi:hypothetical protein